MHDHGSPQLEQIDANRWRLPRRGAMRVDGIVYASSALLPHIERDQSLAQVANVACLPGIVSASLAMPDIHWGYGFPIGGVAAFDMEEGVVSPGGVGYDINCGVRLFRTALQRPDIAGRVQALVDGLFAQVPSGLGSKRTDLKLSDRDYAGVLTNGAGWAVARGFGAPDDLLHIEDGGRIEGADPAAVSKRALERGRLQLGTLGSGNHFIEIAYVDTVFDEPAAQALGLQLDGVVVSVHTGSRGFGYQVCDDAIRMMLKASGTHAIALPDKQLCCAPVRSGESRAYLAAMACAANYAFANRQIIGHWIGRTFEQVLRAPPRDLGASLVYDVCHNIAKSETHTVEGAERMVYVHRKGATRAFPPGHALVPAAYRQIGQPVLIPGDMGRCSYVLVGTGRAMQETFGSTCHGAGRLMSRNQAHKASRGRSIAGELEQRGVVVRASGRATLAEEMPEAYKDVNMVVDVVDAAGVGKKVARLRPLGVMKG
jgi:tRNA-splicing ligase RtcB (3'-phosphate/5'-hydroxy nucleic acid ligase)